MGLVLAEKKIEPLDALLQAYKARFKPQETLEERWKRFPNLTIEARHLEIYKNAVGVFENINSFHS